MRRFALVCFAAATLAGCSDRSSDERAGRDLDPAIADALADPILVDPQLSGQANTDALRPVDLPFSAPYPTGVPVALDRLPLAARLGDVVATDASGRGAAFAGCALTVKYGMGWATRLPTGLALPGGAQVIEAAGSDRGACRLRLVSYVDRGTVIDTLGWWRNAAMRAGYAVTPGGVTDLVARRGRDGAVLDVAAAANDGGVGVDVRVNRGG